MSRLSNTIRNTSYGLVAQIITILINFLNRTIFIHFLGVEYLGLSGLFSNILSMLSLSELGLGVAITYSLYKPLAEDDRKKTKALMHFYCKAYRIIGFTILFLGLLLVPFLNVLIKDPSNIPHFTLIYLLFLMNTVVSYFFTYKRSLLTADQKEYLNTKNRTIFHIIQSILYFLVLVLFKNYIIYLLVTIVCTVASNIAISVQCNKTYPFLKKNTETLSSAETKTLMKYVFAQMSHKVGGVVVSGTDNLLTTSLVSGGLSLVGLYSNYLLLTNTIRSVIAIFFNAVIASVGNLNVQNDVVKSKNVFNKMFFLNMFFYGITTTCILTLANDFIVVWIGEEFLLTRDIVLLIVANYYLTGMRLTCTTFNTTLGLFYNDRFKPWIEAAVNLVASIVLAKHLGFIGILLGTFISTVTVCFWVEPYILYKHYFKIGLWDYFKRFLIYTFMIVVQTLIAFWATNWLTVTNFGLWLIKAIIIGVISVGITVLVYFKTPEFKYFVENANRILKKTGSKK